MKAVQCNTYMTNTFLQVKIMTYHPALSNLEKCSHN